MREYVTTALEVLGLLLWVASVGVFVDRATGLPEALAVSGLLLVVASAIVTLIGERRR